MSTSERILAAYDRGQLWPSDLTVALGDDIAQAYQVADGVARQRLERGERAKGIKIGFTTKSALENFGLDFPMWGYVWDTTVRQVPADQTCKFSLSAFVQPRIEPELVFEFHQLPGVNASKEEIFDCITSVCVGFEIVQCHCPQWQITAPIAIGDGGLHAGLLIAEQLPIQGLAVNVAALEAMLASATVDLVRDDVTISKGSARHVLGSPLVALSYFFRAPFFQAVQSVIDRDGTVLITTGSWTNPCDIAAGETWSAHFSGSLGHLAVSFQQ